MDQWPTTPFPGYEPNLLDIPVDFFRSYLHLQRALEAFRPVPNLQSWRREREESANAEIDDEHFREAVASPLFTWESEAEASVAQTYH